MDNAVTLNSPGAVATAPGFGSRLAALPAKSKFNLGMGAAALVGIVVALLLWSNQGDYKVLYANLSDKDGGAIIAQLSQMNIPYRHSDGGAAILVPASKVHDARLKLASAGLPKASVGGFEMMDSARFGQTQFQERLTFQRGLEGELSRSIGSLAAVESARVHLALPNQNGFFREQQKPSASVVLSLHAGRTLDRGQVAGIVHLVSSSVPEMSPKAVSVLDQTGALISSPPDVGQQAGLDAQQLQYVAQVEQGYSKRIFELLEPVVGRENLRANVTADIDFAQIESTEEAFKPNQGASAPATVRSQQTTEQSGSNPAQAAGVPGATSNQPPLPAAAPVTGAAAPLQTAQNGGAVGNSRREAVTNFEVDKTVRVTRNATGNIKRLNAAVVVNNRSVTDPKGKVTQVPLAPEELEKLTALVQESIGFNKERGDSVRVINAPFKVEPITVVDTPIWKQPEIIDMLRAAAVPAGLSLVALLVFFGMIKPGLNAALAPAVPLPGSAIDASVDDVEVLPGLPQGEVRALEAPRNTESLDAARALAKENPAAVAQIVRGWVSGQPA
ncbi:MAG TPA: flagellar basal-body MS-ring/collar protein FliF [Burkholderiaceae bacterium]|jgi:flagellar M-ring protein FliF|nr:flagellar basal-body MS-ring/collar protein FliF [Burkholderiaceae bacterium]